MAIETLQQLVRGLAHHGDQPALVAFVKDDTQVWSFAELTRCVPRLATGLAEAGIERGDYVAFFAPNSPEWVVACLALLDAGAVPVLIEAQIGQDDLHHVLADSEVRWIVTTRNQAERLRQREGVPNLRLILLDVAQDDPQSWRRYFSDAPHERPAVAPEDTAALFYTSGTSGRPKSVPLSHRNLASNLQALLELHLILENDRLLVPLPLHHVYLFMVGMLAPLAAGVPILFPSSLTGPQLLRSLKEGSATAIIGVPGMYEALLGGIEARVRRRGRLASALFHLALGASVLLRRRFDLRIGRRLFASLHRQFGPHLRAVISGGAALKSDLAWQLEGLGFQVGSGYGLTETSPVLTFNAPGRGRIETAGCPLPGVEIRIAEPQPPAEHGEVLARGLNIFSGYRNLPEKTKEAFTAEDFFRTGDLGYFAVPALGTKVCP
jgi:Long-chain acyl-CoA synthetases (AMP-forming)